MTIYEAIGTVATSMGVSYLKGSWKEIQQRLKEQAANPSTRAIRYPCLCLVTSGLEANVLIGGDKEYNCNITLLMSTQKTYTLDDRITNVYEPTLYPMRDNFFKYAKYSKYFSIDYDAGYIESDAPFNPFTDQEEQNNLAAILDAIEIKNLKITLFKTC